MGWRGGEAGDRDVHRAQGNELWRVCRLCRRPIVEPVERIWLFLSHRKDESFSWVPLLTNRHGDWR